MQIFVVGKLGELIKKVIELEYALKEDATNTFIIAELAACQNVLDMWPVLNKQELTQAVDIFKFNIANLRDKELALREENTIVLYDVLAKNKYFRALDDTRSSLTYINRLGEHIGTSSLLEVHDADVATVNS